MSKAVVKENKMATMPVNKLMMNMGVPMIISMMLQAVYNIVDSAFVANMEGTGEMALNALTLAFPVQMLMVAIGIGTGVGVNALLAKSMGQGDMEKAGKTAGNGVFGLSGETKQLCVSAMRVISVSYMFAGANIAFQGIFQALDSGLESLIISVCRQFLFVIPVAYLFAELVISGMCGTWLVWMSFVIAEVLSVIVSVVFMKRVNTKKVMSMN